MYIHMAGTDLASTERACNGIGEYMHLAGMK